jgi:arsenite-transporting ATPase
MPLNEQTLNNKRVIMFGGKGGVGKTTCSATTALHYAQNGRKTLIISSDLTPSLSDIFETEIGPTETPIPGVPNLHGLEINPDEVMARWKEKFGPEVYAAASSLVDMPYDQLIDYVAIAPGIQEEFMLDYILERIKDGGYNLIVWDTAPAGDTLRLLGLPQQFLKHLRMAPKIYLEVRDRFNLKKVPFVELIESWSELSEEVMGFFRDPANTEFVLVTIPEALGVYQAQRLVDEFARFGLRIRTLIVNHVIQEPDCPFHEKRAAMQRPYIALLEEQYDNQMDLVQLPAFAREMKGIDRLQILEKILFEE